MNFNRLGRYLKNYKFIISLFVLCLFVFGCLFILGSKDKRIPMAAKELEELSENIRKYYQNRPDYWGLQSNIVIKNQIVPSVMIKNNELIGVLKNKILVGNGINASVLMPGARGFDIVYKNLSKNHCVDLASFDFNKQFWLGVTYVSIVHEDNIADFSWNNNQNKLPITQSAAKNACKNGGSIIWHFE